MIRNKGDKVLLIDTETGKEVARVPLSQWEAMVFRYAYGAHRAASNGFVAAKILHRPELKNKFLDAIITE